ncbi:glycosyltransferase [Pontibacter diazotrophicus]|uniref:Glycosyltransferase n=1 Tax=Pontibacter diazotrophicus TaxID=1400979 RepID=A0A3D8LI12_9BACT|nr:glycosyltransferase family 4 protein [Pontibacter diazotrophicus]RDV17089.1 glycosyltransferase [Pontibacter diazotrophicus]
MYLSNSTEYKHPINIALKQNEQEIYGTIAIVIPAVAREGITKLVLSQIKSFQDERYRIVMIVLANVAKDVFEEAGVQLSADELLVLKQQDAYLSVRSLFNSSLLLTPITKFLRYHNAKLVIAHAPYAHFVMRLVKLRLQFDSFNIKLVQYFHITQYVQFPLNSAKRRAVNQLNRVLGKYFDDSHVSVTEAVKSDIESNLFKHKRHLVIVNALPREAIVQNGYSIEEVQRVEAWLRTRSGSFKILIPGRLSYMKGQLFFLQVLSIFIKNNLFEPQDLAVLIVGDGPDKEVIKELINKKGIKGYCYFSPAVQNAALMKVMTLVDLVAVPSHYEGFGLVVLEALQNKRLVLSSDAGGLKEIIEHGRNGFMFRAGVVNDCLEKLQFIYDNRDTGLVDLDEVAQQVEYKFSFEQHMAQLIQVINSCEVG